MKLINNARTVLLKAWSVRLMAVSVFLSFVDVLNSIGSDNPILQALPEPYRQKLALIIAVAALIARFVAQQAPPKE